VLEGIVTVATTKPLTHRPSRLDSEHTACGLRLDDTVHLHLGEGQTCECCAHVVAQVAAALRGEPSWAEALVAGLPVRLPTAQTAGSP
jgi:hypothetical protein